MGKVSDDVTANRSTARSRAAWATGGHRGALITMVQPHVGHERAYNRWYEDDHFYAGAMCMPWMMAGRRFVAARELQVLRYPRTPSSPSR